MRCLFRFTWVLYYCGNAFETLGPPITVICRGKNALALLFIRCKNEKNMVANILAITCKFQRNRLIYYL